MSKSAQAVIDAIRIVLMYPNDPKSALGVVNRLIDVAPETDDNGGADLLLEMISEGEFTVALT